MMNLQKTIRIARANKASFNEIILLLALFETDAMTTPHFAGVFYEDKIEVALKIIKDKQRLLYNDYVDCWNAMYRFCHALSLDAKLNVSIKDLHDTFNAIKNQGEEVYEFKTFETVD